ncbi:YigZ family protein [Sulfobacillus thermosulfidooxidans]|uniref:YigZ family protein n=1 Tax=Sulfobacillus thermosulfidooxidans TaxID=28034 RepID=UPI001494A230|nr:YigZ family protein [Sulfobacillus thermosulfidooxidans]
MNAVIQGEWAEITVRHSRFISRAFSCPSSTTFEQILRYAIEHWPKATHYVWAYVIRPGEERMTDDGEPTGTAGPPTLNLIQKRHLIQTAIVTVRYFGGTKLGTGGLVHAYQDAAANALSHALLGHEEEVVTVILDIPYSEWGRTENYLMTKNISYSADFRGDVHVQCEIPIAISTSVLNTLRNDLAPHLRVHQTKQQKAIVPNII